MPHPVNATPLLDLCNSSAPVVQQQCSTRTTIVLQQIVSPQVVVLSPCSSSAHVVQQKCSTRAAIVLQPKFKVFLLFLKALEG